MDKDRRAKLELYSKMVRKPMAYPTQVFKRVNRMSRQQVKSALKRGNYE